jgi:hypothetical protein
VVAVIAAVVVAVLLDAFVTSVERERELLHNHDQMLAEMKKAQVIEGSLCRMCSLTIGCVLI